MKLNAWCKENNTYYSVVSGMIKRGTFPAKFYKVAAGGKYEIINENEAATWFAENRRTKKSGATSTMVQSANDKIVREGDFTVRTVGKRKHVEKVRSISESLIQTDDGLSPMSQPWTRERFKESHIITTPKAIVNLLIEEFKLEERPNVVEALEEVLTQLDIYIDPDTEEDLDAEFTDDNTEE